MPASGRYLLVSDRTYNRTSTIRVDGLEAPGFGVSVILALQLVAALDYFRNAGPAPDKRMVTGWRH